METAPDKVETTEFGQDITENLQKPDFNQLGKDLTEKIAKVIEEFEQHLPNIFMIKILQNISTDLMIRQTNYQILYKLQELSKEQEQSSRIKLV